MTIFISIAAAIAMTFFAQPITEEKEKKLKYMMNIMGLKTLPYWLGNFIFDFILIVLYTVTFIILGVSVNNVDLIKDGLVWWVICVFLAGWSVCLL